MGAYDNGLVHSEFCLNREDVAFRNGAIRLAWADRMNADMLKCFVACRKQIKKGTGVSREGAKCRGGGGGGRYFFGILEMHPELENQTPVVQITDKTQAKWHVVFRTEATRYLMLLASSLEDGP